MSRELRLVVVARLSDVKLRSKLAPLAAMPEVAEISLVRRTPLGMERIRSLCPPRPLAGRTPLAEPWRLAALLRRCARRPRPSCLISYFFIPHAFYIEVARRLFGIPTVPVAISHEDIERACTSRFWSGVVRNAHAVGVRGARSAELLLQLGLPRERVFAPPNVFEPGPFVPDASAPKDWDVVYSGGLEPVKRLDVLIEALALARRRIARLRVLLVGEGPQRSVVETAIRRHGLADEVVLAGPLPREELAGLLQRSRLLALTSRYEGLPMAMIEALSCGVPVVVPDIGDVTTVARHGENAWVVSDARAASFAEAFATLLSDPERLERLAAGARASRERFLAEYSLESAAAAWRPVLARLEA